MNFEFAEKINLALKTLDFTKALKIAKQALEELPVSDFHAVLDRTLIEQADELVNWVDDFYQLASKERDIKSLYLEINEFDINTDMWFLEGFAYLSNGGLDLENLENMDWLCDYDGNSPNVFELKGFELLQTAFSKIEIKEENGDWTDELQDARDWCEQIIIIKFMELVRQSHIIAKQKKLLWAKIPIYFTEHGYDFIVKSE